jgi:magnesium transporter
MAMPETGSPLREPARLVVYGPDSYAELSPATPEEAVRLARTGVVAWFDLSLDSDAGWLEGLAPALGLHALAVEDAQARTIRAKLEEFENHILFVVNTVEASSDGMAQENVAFMLGEGFVVTVQQTREDCWDRVRSLLREPGHKARSRGADFLAAMLVDETIESLYPAIEGVSDEIERLEDELLEAPTRSAVQKVYRLRSDLVSLRRAVWPSRDVVRQLGSEDTKHVGPDQRKYFRDAYDHAALALDLAETMRERVSNLTDLYLSSVGFRQNEVLKVLTVVSATFIPITFVAGVYGMNFDPAASPWSMPELRQPWGYVITWAVMLAIALGQLTFFWRKGWLKTN